MTVTDHLERWRDTGIITTEQHARLDGLVRGTPYSVFLPLNILLYTGVLAFTGGLGWTVRTYSQQLGDVVILIGLSALLVACLVWCFIKAPPFSRTEPPSPNTLLDYVLYLGSLVWSVELAYLELRFHMMSGQWDSYLLASAAFYFALAYRFDNRFVLSLALSALGGWFGLRLGHLSMDESTWRQCAMAYGVLIATAGFVLQSWDVKAHFTGTYLGLAANVVFIAVLSEVIANQSLTLWFLVLLGVCGASAAYGVARREFSFVAYAALYGYVGITIVVLRHVDDATAIFTWFLLTGIAMVFALVRLSRQFAREA